MFGLEIQFPGADARLVNEQDLVMQLRRLNRVNEARVVANILLSALPKVQANEQLKEKIAVRLNDLVRKMDGTLSLMGNGDAFLLLPPTTNVQALPDVVMRECLMEASPEPDAVADTILTYSLPADYLRVRERADHYITLARNAVPGGIGQVELALQSEIVRGPLSAYSLHQIKKLLAAIDLRRYVRTQNIYEKTGGGWRVWQEEGYVSLRNLQVERFPRVNVATPERLFLDLCATLDAALLNELSQRPDVWRGRCLSLNLNAETILGAPFAQFCHVLPRESRHEISFEIHRADLFQNFETTLGAIELLRREGFGVALDGLTPNVLPYLAVTRFAVDYYKVSAEKDSLNHLRDFEVQRALTLLPPEKLVLYHCENETALQLGQGLGVTRYQGWYIDDLVSHEAPAR